LLPRLADHIDTTDYRRRRNRTDEGVAAASWGGTRRAVVRHVLTLAPNKRHSARGQRRHHRTGKGTVRYFNRCLYRPVKAEPVIPTTVARGGSGRNRAPARRKSIPCKSLISMRRRSRGSSKPAFLWIQSLGRPIPAYDGQTIFCQDLVPQMWEEAERSCKRGSFVPLRSLHPASCRTTTGEAR